MTYFSKSNQSITLEEAKREFDKLNGSIRDLLYKMGDDAENIQSDRDDLDQEFYRSEYRSIFSKLEDIYSDIKYLSNPVTEQGYISHNSSGRYELPSGTYFTSGSSCEILYNDTRHNEQYWVATAIEHNGEDYYAVALGRDTSINGMMVRIRARG